MVLRAARRRRSRPARRAHDLARIEATPGAAMRSTCAMTKPLEFFAAIASARLSSVSASRSIVMLPVGIGGRAANQRDVDRERLVEQPLLAVDRHQPTRSSVVRALILPPS